MVEMGTEPIHNGVSPPLSKTKNAVCSTTSLDKNIRAMGRSWLRSRSSIWQAKSLRLNPQHLQLNGKLREDCMKNLSLSHWTLCKDYVCS